MDSQNSREELINDFRESLLEAGETVEAIEIFLKPEHLAKLSDDQLKAFIDEYSGYSLRKKNLVKDMESYCDGTLPAVREASERLCAKIEADVREMRARLLEDDKRIMDALFADVDAIIARAKASKNKRNDDDACISTSKP